MSIVFVIDSEGNPLLPTHPARSRKLLRENKARIKSVVPFTIQLNRKIDKPIGKFIVGIDDGAKYVGIAVKNNKTNIVVFHGQLKHRQDVSKKMEARKNYRKNRRRKLRYRQPRFSNRIGRTLQPSIRQRKDCIIRVIKDLRKCLNIIEVKVEEVSFNQNKVRYKRYFSLVQIGKNYLKENIQKLGLIYKRTFGYFTLKSRLKLGLSKRHSYDACAVLKSNKLIGTEYYIKPKRTKCWENNPTKTCKEKNGFRHYDLVKSRHGKRGIVIGSVRSLKASCITLRTKFDDNFPVSYSKTVLLQRFGGLVYSF